MQKIAIVGAGMAGLACAQALRAAGHNPALFDKGRRAGGRMSARRMMTPLGEAGFDHGAQYFTARDPAFQAQVAEWQQLGLVAPWPASGADAWVGTPAMNAPVRHLAGSASVQWDVRVEALAKAADGWRLHGNGIEPDPFDAVLLAVPAENAAPLLEEWDPAMAARAVATPAMPCWTVMAAFGERVPVDADVLRERGPIGWAARNSAKPGRSGPESWVIQADPDWSRQHLEETAETVIPALLAAFAERVGAALPNPLGTAAHRWRYSRSGNSGDGMLWNAQLGLGVCGDWLLGPRVECAWLSGTRLASAMG